MNGAPRQLRGTLDTLINTPPPQSLPYKAVDDYPVSPDGTTLLVPTGEDDATEIILCERQRDLVQTGMDRLAGLRSAADSWAIEARLALGESSGPEGAAVAGIGATGSRGILEELLANDVVRVVQARKSVSEK